MDEMCKEIEDLDKKDNELMFTKIKDITGKRKCNNNIAVKRTDGTVAMEEEEVKERWSEYIGELFLDQRPDSMNIQYNNEGPEILQQEVRAAIESMKKGKAVGSDDIAIEMIQALGVFAIKELTGLFSKMYENGNIIKSLCESIFITIPKVEGTLECSKHRTISIMSQITKIMLRVILRRIRAKLRPQISQQQFGFVAGKGTRNAIFALRVLAERAIDVQKDLYVCFVDYEKAFDKVRHQDLFNILNDIGLDGKDLRLLEKLYWNQKAAVRVGGEVSEWQDIKRGVRQGCVLSPDLFNIYSEIIMRDLENLEGLKIGGQNLNNVRYADDTALVADSEEKLDILIKTLVQSSENRGLKLNTSKTKVMLISKKAESVPINIIINGERLEQVDSFKYLGSLITKDARCEKEIKTRTALAKMAFGKVRPLVTNTSISLNLRKRFIKAYAHSTLLYGCESWTISKAMQKKIEATEMWFMRRMLKIPWTERVTNEEVLRRAGTRRELMKSIRQRQLRFLGHVMREQQLESQCVAGKLEGKRGRGRPREKFIDSLARAAGGGHTPAQMLKITMERENWRRLVDNVPWDTSLR